MLRFTQLNIPVHTIAQDVADLKTHYCHPHIPHAPNNSVCIAMIPKQYLTLLIYFFEKPISGFSMNSISRLSSLNSCFRIVIRQSHQNSH